MASTPAIRARGGGPLGRWVAGPIAGLAVLVLLGSNLPSYACDDARGLGSSTLGVVFEVLGLGGAAVLLGLGIWRAVQLRHRREHRRWPLIDRPSLAVIVLALAGFVYLSFRHGEIAAATLAAAFFFGLLLTGIAFLALTVAAIRQERADAVGLLLPIYLAGVGICVYLPVVAFAGELVGGCWGE
jgi:hypothetical protein